MIKENKNAKLAFKIIGVLSVIGIVASLITNLAINRRLTWAGIVIGGICFAFFIMAALLLSKKNKIFYALIVSSISVIPLLYVISFFQVNRSWVSKVGVPIAIASIISIWISFLIIRFSKINIWKKFSILVFVNGIFLNFFIKYFINKVYYLKFFSLDLIINVVSAVAITVLLYFIGTMKDKPKS